MSRVRSFSISGETLGHLTLTIKSQVAMTLHLDGDTAKNTPGESDIRNDPSMADHDTQDQGEA